MKDMHRITRDDVMALLRRVSPGGVLSVYIGLPTMDRHDPQKWLSAVRSGLKELGQRRAAEKGLPALIETALNEISRLPLEARHRSLVYFRSLDPDWGFWRSLQPFVPDLMAFEPSPQVRHLVALLDETPALGVAVISQERTRLFSWKQGTIEELPEILLEPEEEVRVPLVIGGRGTTPPAAPVRTGIPKNRAADQTRRRLSRLGQTIGEVGSAHDWQHILLLGPATVTAPVSASLSDPWRRSLIGQVDRNLIGAPVGQIAAEAGRQLHEWKRRAELREIEWVVNEASSGGRARTGIDACLDHLHERRVERLFVCGDLQLSGFRDSEGRLYAHTPEPNEANGLSPEPRLVERMVVSALENGASVVPLEGESARRLSLLGGVGARLRWKTAGNGLFPDQA